LKSARREQEAFTAQYQLIGVQEELQKAQERIQVIESERDALKTSLQDEEVALIAAEGRIALPAMADDDDDDLLQSPRKSPRKPRLASEDSDCGDKENRVPRKTIELQSLHEELAMERRMREKAQEQVDFMKMECQFQCCSCRIAEKDGHGYVHDMSFVSEMERIRAVLPRGDTPPLLSDHQDVEMLTVDDDEAYVSQAPDMIVDSTDAVEKSFHTAIEPSEIPLPQSEPEQHTAETEVTEEMIDVEVIPEPEPQPEMQEDADMEQRRPPTPTFAIPEPQTPLREIRTITTTTTIPIMFSPFPGSQQPTTPMTIGHLPLGPGSPFTAGAIKPDGTLDREAALAQIRERRGRARSVAMGHATPRKQMVEGVTGRRDISAPTLR
jgi:hypothetical protein